MVVSTFQPEGGRASVLVVEPVVPGGLSGVVTVPPSKSETMRALVAAAMAHGESRIERGLCSPDVMAMVTACRRLGAEVTCHPRDAVAMDVVVRGVGACPVLLPGTRVDAGNSGLVLRCLVAMAALSSTACFFDGDTSLRTRRGLAPLLDALTQCGAQHRCDALPGYAPVTVQGPVVPSSVVMAGHDSQPVSAMLLMAGCLNGTTTLEVKPLGERPWVDLTLAWLTRLGVPWSEEDAGCFRVVGSGGWSGFHATVPADWSSAAFPMVAALVTASDVVLEGLDPQALQGDRVVVDRLCAMGADIAWEGQRLHVKGRSSTLVGRTWSMDDWIDAVPILSVLGACAAGRTTLNDAAMARQKESDRVAAMLEGLSHMGCAVQPLASEDGLVVEGSVLKGATLRGHEDHRVVMAMAVAGMAASQGETRVEGARCLAKTFPTFVDAMQAVGATLRWST